MTTVHVMGPPDPLRRLKEDERYCLEPDAGQTVVFHPRRVSFDCVQNGHRMMVLDYICSDCGESADKAEA